MSGAVNDRDEAGAGVHIGVGINTGSVVAGSIGGGGRLNFSVIGDPVNVASRVESATRSLDADVLITDQTRKTLSDEFEVDDVGRHRLRGIDAPVALYAPRPVPDKPSTLPGVVAAAEGDGDGRRSPLRVAAETARRAARRATTRG